jgi:hypothetical protein
MTRCAAARNSWCGNWRDGGQGWRSYEYPMSNYDPFFCTPPFFAGAYTPGNFWETWWEGTKRLGTPMNDIRPRNIGANRVIFDPAFHPVQRGVYWTLGGVGSLWVGYGVYEMFQE